MLADPEHWFQFGFPAAFLVLLVVLFSAGFMFVTRMGAKGAEQAWGNLFGETGFMTDLKRRHMKFLDDIESQVEALTAGLAEMQRGQQAANERAAAALSNLSEKLSQLEREGAVGSVKAALLQLTEIVAAGHDVDPVMSARLERIRSTLTGP